MLVYMHALFSCESLLSLCNLKTVHGWQTLPLRISDNNKCKYIEWLLPKQMLAINMKTIEDPAKVDSVYFSHIFICLHTFLRPYIIIYCVLLYISHLFL